MSHPRTWLEVRPAGLYCRPGDFYVDPVEPVPRAVITHAHADHARGGHGWVMATPDTLAIMRLRYGEAFAGREIALDYQERFSIAGEGGSGATRLTLVPAGHILGSAQIVAEHGDHRVVISGDYKRTFDPTCAPFEVVTADVFVTEATFALPVFRWPEPRQEIAKLLESLATFPGSTHLVGVYALGKCQRLLALLRLCGYQQPVFLHGALVKMCELYESRGVALGEWAPVAEVTDKSSLRGRIVLAPPSALADRWSRRLPEVIPAMASGWMQIRARARQRRVELPLILSDHCDWPELLQTIEEVAAPEVWVTHGRDDALVHHVHGRGRKAQALSMLGYDEEET